MVLTLDLQSAWTCEAELNAVQRSALRQLRANPEEISATPVVSAPFSALASGSAMVGEDTEEGSASLSAATTPNALWYAPLDDDDGSSEPRGLKRARSDSDESVDGGRLEKRLKRAELGGAVMRVRHVDRVPLWSPRPPSSAIEFYLPPGEDLEYMAELLPLDDVYEAKRSSTLSCLSMIPWCILTFSSL